MSGSISGTSRGCPPHWVGKPYTHSPPSSIVTLQTIYSVIILILHDSILACPRNSERRLSSPVANKLQQSRPHHCGDGEDRCRRLQTALQCWMSSYIQIRSQLPSSRGKQYTCQIITTLIEARFAAILEGRHLGVSRLKNF